MLIYDKKTLGSPILLRTPIWYTGKICPKKIDIFSALFYLLIKQVKKKHVQWLKKINFYKEIINIHIAS